MKLPIFKTDQYDEFQCAGGDCPYTCCGGYWKIYVDEETDKRYQAMTGEFADRLNSVIDRSQTPATIRLAADGRCPMLTEDGWCSVQRTLGEEALCTTCKTYPRRSRTAGGVIVIYQTPSCIEAARELLSRKKPLRLLAGTTDVTAGAKPVADGGAAAWAALKTAFKILQDRDCGVDKRQLLFLLFSQSLRDAADKPDEAAALTDYFSKPSNRRALAAEQPDAGGGLPEKLRLLNRLCAPLLAENPNPWASALLRDVLRYVIADDGGIERAAPYFTRLHEGAFARELETVLAHTCLMNYFDDALYGGDCFLQAGYIVALAQLWRLCCAVGSAWRGEPIPPDECIRYWSFLSHAFVHDPCLAERVSGILRDEGLLELPFLFRLIS